MSFDVILPFLRPIAHLIQDPDVSEIMVNGSHRVFIERQGLVQEVTDVRVDELHEQCLALAARAAQEVVNTRQRSYLPRALERLDQRFTSRPRAHRGRIGGVRIGGWSDRNARRESV
jgi:hypothetical protein